MTPVAGLFCSVSAAAGAASTGVSGPAGIGEDGVCSAMFFSQTVRIRRAGFLVPRKAERIFGGNLPGIVSQLSKSSRGEGAEFRANGAGQGEPKWFYSSTRNHSSDQLH